MNYLIWDWKYISNKRNSKDNMLMKREYLRNRKVKDLICNNKQM